MVLLILYIDRYEGGDHSKIYKVQEKADFFFDDEVSPFEKL